MPLDLQFYESMKKLEKVKILLALMGLASSLSACTKASESETSSEATVQARIEVKKAPTVDSSKKDLIRVLEQSHKIFDEVRNKIELRHLRQSSVFKSSAAFLMNPKRSPHLVFKINPTRIERADGVVISEFIESQNSEGKTQWQWSFPSTEYQDSEVGISAKILNYKIQCSATSEGKKLLALECKNLSFNKGSLEHVNFESFKFNRMNDPAIEVRAFKYQNLTEKKSEVSVTVPLVGVIDYLEREMPEEVLPTPSLATKPAAIPTAESPANPEVPQRKPTLNTQYDEEGNVLPEDSEQELDVDSERQAEVLSQT